ERNAVNAGCVCDSADKLAVVGIDHVHLRAVREVETSSIAIDCHVVEPTIARHVIARLDLVPGTGLKEQSSRHRNKSILNNHWIIPFECRSGECSSAV